MPNATMQANARTLPEAKTRRAVLAASLAAGASAALPASAAQQPLSPTDRQVLALWQRRAELRAIATRISEQHAAACAQLPKWADRGPVYVRVDGGDAEMAACAGWPIAADLSRRPVERGGIINVRPGPDDLRAEFQAAFYASERADDRTGVLEDYARVFAEFAERRRQQESEHRRLGLDVLSSRHDVAWGAVADVENELDQHLGASVLALAAVLIVAIHDDCEEIEGLNRAALAAIRPQLTGAIAEDADRALAAEDEEAA